MPQNEFILQGLTPRAHREAVRSLFDIPDINKVILGVAFVTETGVDQIQAQLEANAAHLTVFAGIRNDITSRQGLVRLHTIGGALYAVDTGSRTILFHPKVFIVRGTNVAKMVLGSANLTPGGLSNNIEAGLLLTFDLNEPADKTTVDIVDGQLTALPQEFPDNFLQVNGAADIDHLFTTGRIVDEMAMPAPRPSTSAGQGGGHDAVPRIALKTPVIRRQLAKAAPAPQPGPAIFIAPAVPGIRLELVWQSKALTRRDLTIPAASGTHATGSVNLDKGLLPDDVDHRHYFRDDVFSALVWAATSASGAVEEAHARFQLIIKGVSYGEYDLRLGHTTSTTSTAYQQRNAMTRLSWGPMREHIARPDLIGRTLSLYRDEDNPTRFVLEID